MVAHKMAMALLPAMALLRCAQAQEEACAAGSFLAPGSGECAVCPAGTYDGVPDAAGYDSCALSAFVEPTCEVTLVLDLPLLGNATDNVQGVEIEMTGHAITTQCDGTCGLILDGDGDRATVAHFDYADDGSFTYSFWITKPACTGNSWEYVYSHNRDLSSIASPQNSGINTFFSCGNSYIRSGMQPCLFSSAPRDPPRRESMTDDR